MRDGGNAFKILTWRRLKGIVGRTELEWILQKIAVSVEVGLIHFRIYIFGELLWMCHWTWRSVNHRKLNSCWKIKRSRDERLMWRGHKKCIKMFDTDKDLCQSEQHVCENSKDNTMWQSLDTIATMCHVHSRSSNLQRPLWVSKPLNKFCVLFYLSLSCGDLFIFWWKFPLLFLFMCYLHFGTCLFHMVS